MITTPRRWCLGAIMRYALVLAIEMTGITRCKLTIIISESAVRKKFLGQII